MLKRSEGLRWRPGRAAVFAGALAGLLVLAGEPAWARAAGIEWGADDTRLRVSADISTAGAIAASPPFRTGFQDLMNVQLSPPSSLPAAPAVTDDALVRSGENVFAIEARALKDPHFIASITHVVGGTLVPVAGGVLVRDAAGTLLGAVGISGDTSDNDEAAACAAIAAVGLTAETGR